MFTPHKFFSFATSESCCATVPVSSYRTPLAAKSRKLDGRRPPMFGNSHRASCRRRIGLVLIPRFSLISFTSMRWRPLRLANRMASGHDLYDWRIYLSTDGAPGDAPRSGHRRSTFRCCDLQAAESEDIDCAVVCGGLDIQRFDDRQGDRPGCAGWAGAALDIWERFCTGSHILARAGLLDGHRCTIHWENLASFRRGFPRRRGDGGAVRDRPPAASPAPAGPAAIDLMLNVIGRAARPRVGRGGGRPAPCTSASATSTITSACPCRPAWACATPSCCRSSS